jgi:hypothetical protein
MKADRKLFLADHARMGVTDMGPRLSFQDGDAVVRCPVVGTHSGATVYHSSARRLLAPAGGHRPPPCAHDVPNFRRLLDGPYLEPS